MLMKLEFYWRAFKKFSDIKFHENLSSGNRVVLWGWMDRWTDMMKLIVAFCNFANAPNKWSVLEAVCHSHSSFTSISWALSFFISTIIWCVSVVFALYYVHYVVPWVRLSEWYPGFHGSLSGHSQGFYEWVIYLHLGFMVLVELGLWVLS